MGREWVGMGCVSFFYNNFTNPGLEWGDLVLATFDALPMRFILRDVTRDATRSTDFGTGLGPEWGGNGLERVVFFICVRT